MERADAILRQTFERAGAADRYRCNFYGGGHKFDSASTRDRAPAAGVLASAALSRVSRRGLTNYPG